MRYAVRILGATIVVCLVAAMARAQVNSPTVTKAGQTASSGVGVQGVTGGVPVAVSGSFSATVSDPSVTSTGVAPPSQAALVGAVASSTAPSYASGTFQPLSMDTAGALRISGTISATAVEASVTSTGNAVPAQATFVGGVDAAGKLRGLPMSTSTPAASDLALVVRMPSGASGLTDGELRAAPVAVSSTIVGAGTATTTPLYVVTTNSSSLSGSIGVTQSTTPWVIQGNVTSTISGTVTVTSTDPLGVSIVGGSISASVSDPSVTSTGNAVPSQAQFVAGVDAAGKLRGLPMSTSTPAASDLGLVVRSIGTTSIGASIGVTQSSTPWVTSVITGVTSTIVGPLGQTTMAASVPVTLASNQSVISVTSTSSQLPAALGQTTMAASLPVTLASNQGTISVTSTSSQLPAALGQTTMAASLPVTLASNQGTISVTSTSSQLPASLGQKAMSASFPVVIASDNSVTTTAAAYGSEGVKLSTANSGRLQVDVITGGGSNASVGTVTSTVPTSATQIGGWSTGGQLLVPFVMTSTPAGAEPGLVVRMPAGASGLTNTELRASPVGVSQSSTPWTTVTNNSVVSGTLGGLGMAVTSTLNGMFGVAFAITATSTLIGTLTPSVSIDGTTWTPTAFLDYAGSSTPTLTTAASTAYQYGVALIGGAQYARVAVTSYTSGTSSAFIVATMAQNIGNVVYTIDAVSTGSTYSATTSTGDLSFGVVSSTLTYTDGQIRPVTLATDGALRVDTLAGMSTTSTGVSTATTLTELITGSAGKKIYIKNWKCSASVASTTSSNEQCLLKYGTGSACGTGTTVLDGCFTPANGGCLAGELVAPAATNVCWMHAAAGSKIVTITYRIAP